MSKSQRIAKQIADGCIAQRAGQLDRTIARIYDGHLRPLGLRRPQLTTLVALTLHEGVRAGQLASALRIEKSTLSRNVARLADQGLVAIRETDDGGRALFLTKSGRAKLVEAHPAWKAAQREARAFVDEAALARLAKALP
ncbi:MAG: MarR family winged helix-turn-helix transcriptional regulator [Myxococcota bacterium]